MKTKMIIIVLLLAGTMLGAVFAVTAAAVPEATITVDSTADTLIPGDNECTLREAINNANTDSDTTGGDCTAGSGADVIDLPAGTYTLTIPGGDENNNATGDLDILDSLTINGSGALSTTIDGNDLDRVLHIQGTQNQVIFNDLTVTNGYSTQGNRQGGGGILNEDATLTLNNSILHHNTVSGTATPNGGGLYNVSGHVTLNGATVHDNILLSAQSWGGGGLANLAWLSNATMILNSSVVTGNNAPGGGGILSYGLSNVTSTLKIFSSTVAYNLAGETQPGGSVGPGGGIWNTDDTSGVNLVSILEIDNSLIEGNVVDGGNGGGGIYNSGHTSTEFKISIYRSTIRDNQTTYIGGNTGFGGGAFLIGAEVLIDSSTVVSNTGEGTAGGLFFLDTNGTVANSTVSGNSTTGTPGNNLTGAGGGILVGLQYSPLPVQVDLVNTTIAGNNAGNIGGGLAVGSLTGQIPTGNLANTIIAYNEAQVDNNCSINAGIIPGMVQSLGYNLEDEDTCQLDQPTDQINTDPLLGPIQDNGGPTWTHALLDFSPAIDAGDDGVCAAAPVNGVDQRGVARPIGPHCDIGAFESAAMPPVLQFDVYLPVVLKP